MRTTLCVWTAAGWVGLTVAMCVAADNPAPVPTMSQEEARTVNLRRLDEVRAELERFQADIQEVSKGIRELRGQLAEKAREIEAADEGIRAERARIQELQEQIQTLTAGIRQRVYEDEAMVDLQKTLDALLEKARDMGARARSLADEKRQLEHRLNVRDKNEKPFLPPFRPVPMAPGATPVEKEHDMPEAEESR